jgi:hypothetical protein
MAVDPDEKTRAADTAVRGFHGRAEEDKVAVQGVIRGWEEPRVVVMRTPPPSNRRAKRTAEARGLGLPSDQDGRSVGSASRGA